MNKYWQLCDDKLSYLGEFKDWHSAEQESAPNAVWIADEQTANQWYSVLRASLTILNDS